MRQPLFVALTVVSLIASGRSPLRGGPDDLQPTPKDAKPTPERVVELKLVKVVALTEKTITVQYQDELPVEYPFTQQLLTDKRGLPAPGLGHKVSDLAVGDIVEVDTLKDRGVVYCCAVGIHRRPGGKVPPAIEFSGLPERLRWHVRMNAEQAREEKAFEVMERIGRRLAR
jgi:hypothetical protein